MQLPAYNSRRIGLPPASIAAVCMLVAIVVVRLLSGVESLPEIVAEGVLTMMPGASFQRCSTVCNTPPSRSFIWQSSSAC